MFAFSQIAAIAIGAFYVFAGVVVLRAIALDRLMDTLLAALNDPSAPNELMRSRVLMGGAFLTLASGVVLMLLSPLAAPVFVANAVWQGAYLLWADRALPPEDGADARGRQQTKNAFAVYLAATAFVVWLWTQGQLRSWDVPLQTIAIDVAAVVLAAVASWAFIHAPGQEQPPLTAPEPETEAADLDTRLWMVLRTDDAGNVFLIGEDLDEADATELASSLAAREHKQTYTTHAYHDNESRAALLAAFNVCV
jgi:hypothetical protein